MTIDRVAFLSMHTSPLLQPGVGDAGGMNVYVDELARSMVARGVAVDVFTRRHGPDLPSMVEVVPGYVVHHIEAGPPRSLPIRRLARYVNTFADSVADIIDRERIRVIHSHYWLSGWAGLLVKRRLGVGLANSFHTLGRVKDRTRRHDEPPESLLRIATEHEVVEGADCVVASTPHEAEDLMSHYGADPTRLCTSPPGVDHDVFSPGDKAAARRRLGLEADKLVLFVGRIQPLKGLDVAVEAFDAVSMEHPDARLMVVGGPSGDQGESELRRLHARVRALGLEERVTFSPPVPHHELADRYRAADLLLLPSRGESFGLVAVEAQACGVPVVAARVGGLAHVVDDGATGFLVDGWDPAAHAAAIGKLLSDPVLAERMSTAAVEWAARFSWDTTVSRFLELYRTASRRATSN